jgi:hypothetical protein
LHLPETDYLQYCNHSFTLSIDLRPFTAETGTGSVRPTTRRCAMAIVWILGILAVLIGAGMLIDRKHRAAGASEMIAAQRHAERSRRRSAGGAYTSNWAYFGGGDGGGGFGGGFDGGGGCGGDGGGGGSC